MGQKTDLGQSGSTADRRKPAPHLLDPIFENLGPRATTFRGSAVYTIRPPGSHEFCPKDHLISVLLTPVPGMRAARENDVIQEFDAPVGMLLITPANERRYVAWPLARENVVVAITPESLLELAAHEFDVDAVELQPPPYGTIDPVALQLARLLQPELTQRETPNELCVDSLITLLGTHVLRNYSSAKSRTSNARGGLSARSARRVQEFLNENFSRKLSVAELAAVSELSPHHFIEAFSKTFGEPPHQYLIGRRLAFAEKLLVEGDLTIAEVAYLSGFSSQSHLTATMKKHRHTTPTQVRLKR
jgi:AraC family transcriptional regulator